MVLTTSSAYAIAEDYEMLNKGKCQEICSVSFSAQFMGVTQYLLATLHIYNVDQNKLFKGDGYVLFGLNASP